MVVVFRQARFRVLDVGEAALVGFEVVPEAIEKRPLHRRRRALLPRDEGDVIAFARQHGLEEVLAPQPEKRLKWMARRAAA